MKKPPIRMDHLKLLRKVPGDKAEEDVQESTEAIQKGDCVPFGDSTGHQPFFADIVTSLE